MDVCERCENAISAFSGKNASVQFDLRSANSFQYWDVLSARFISVFPTDEEPGLSSRMSEIGQGLGFWIGQTPRINSSIDRLREEDHKKVSKCPKKYVGFSKAPKIVSTSKTSTQQ